MIVTVKPLQGKECSLQSTLQGLLKDVYGDVQKNIYNYVSSSTSRQMVTENEKVSTVKELVSDRLNIPPSQQRLLYKGKSLADEHRLSDYSIGPDAKINLVVRPVGEQAGAAGGASSNSSSSSSVGVWQALSTVLARHFSPTDAARVQEQLIKDYERSLRQLSLDDIERLADRLLHPDAEGMDTSYMD